MKSSVPSRADRGVGFHLEWKGDAGQMLLKAAEKLKNYQPMLETIGRQVTATSKRTFINQMSSDGKPWAPLRFPRGKGHNQNSIVLFDTGDLYRSIDYRLVSSNAVQIFWTPEYGKHHQWGAPRAHIPQRQFLGPAPEDVPETVQTWLKGEVFGWPGEGRNE